MKNTLFSGLFLATISLAACGGDPSADMTNEAVATPAVAAAAPAPVVNVVATKCFNVGSDGVLRVTGPVRFDGPVGINTDPVDGVGLASNGTNNGVKATGFLGVLGVSNDGEHGGIGVEGQSSYVAVYGFGYGTNSTGVNAEGGLDGINATGNGRFGVHAVGTTHDFSGGDGADRVKTLESEVAQLKEQVAQLLKKAL